jgi:integrase
MALSLRKRGKKFHVRGTIKVGRDTRDVDEHSTGCDRREDAEAYRSKLEADIRHEMLHGHGGRAQSMTIADASLRYMGRPRGLAPGDLWRLDQILAIVGDRKIADAPAAWVQFRRERLAGLAPATVQRFRATFQASINYLAADEGFDAPKLPRGEKVSNKRVRYLTDDQADRLIAAYAPHAQPIAITLRWQGVRVGEALRLDWVSVNWSGDSIFIAKSKRRRSPHYHHERAHASGAASAVGRARIAAGGRHIPDAARGALRGPAHVQIPLGERDQENPQDRLPHGQDRRFPRPRLAASLGVVVRDEGDRPGDDQAGGRLEIAADG